VQTPEMFLCTSGLIWLKVFLGIFLFFLNHFNINLIKSLTSFFYLTKTFYQSNFDLVILKSTTNLQIFRKILTEEIWKSES
jgi:hypothetical protein